MLKIVRTWVFALLLLVPWGVRAEVFVSGQSEIAAGEVSSVVISGLTAGESIGASLYRPGEEVIRFSDEADYWGRAVLELHGAHLRRSGDYTLDISRHLFPQEPASFSFQVMPGVVSAYHSQLVLEQGALPADGLSKAFFRVRLRDRYDNPIARQRVRVVSSRNEDIIQHDLETDRFGLAHGSVLSQTPGISTLQVVTGDTVLFEKPSLVFHLAETDMSAVGSDGGLGQFLKAQLFEDTATSTVHRFDLSGLSPKLLRGAEYTFTVTALDASGGKIPDYFGQIRFDSSDDKAQLPLDYTFVKDDQGSHEFSVVLVFNTLGPQTIQVYDLEDFSISGSAEVLVVDDLEASHESGDAGIELLSPVTGTYKSSRMTITGQTQGLESVTIKDGNLVLVEDLRVDESGAFFYQTAGLANGIHLFSVVGGEDPSIQSEEVSVTIDNLPPRALSVSLDPKPPLEQGQDFLLRLEASEPLSEATCVLLDTAYDLVASGDVFVTTMQAPTECGNYRIGCVVADLLGNELEEAKAEEITVCGGDPEPVTEAPDPIEPTPQESGPSTVYQLSGEPQEDRVTLRWEAANDDVGIVHYRVTYGTAIDALDQVNVLPDSRTQWYVDQLSPGMMYFFQVTAVDTDGNLGTPSSVVGVETFGKAQPLPDDSELHESGQNTGWWIPLLLVIGGMFVLRAGVARD